MASRAKTGGGGKLEVYPNSRSRLPLASADSVSNHFWVDTMSYEFAFLMQMRASPCQFRSLTPVLGRNLSSILRRRIYIANNKAGNLSSHTTCSAVPCRQQHTSLATMCDRDGFVEHAKRVRCVTVLVKRTEEGLQMTSRS